jgi:hypothetical protein
MFRLSTAALLLVAPVSCWAASAVSCHCFRDRSFDPGRPAAADPYVLATAQNSLLAAAFGLDKGALVKAKMTGTPGEDLWVAHWAAEKTGARAVDLLDARSRSSGWAQAFGSLGVPAERLGPRAAPLLRRASSDGTLARVAQDDVLHTRLGIDETSLRDLAGAGPGLGEAAAAALLSRRSSRSPLELYRAVAEGQASWGGMFHEAGVEPAAIEEEVRRLLAPPAGTAAGP